MVGLNGYDQSVHYAAADALLHGRIPYQDDFVFLHPPVVAIVGLPFALLGRLSTAHTGFLAANIAFLTLGALTAALVTAVARRAGAPRWGAVSAGLVHALWSVTVGAGSTMRLEPLGDLLFVTALWLLWPGTNLSRRQMMLAGVVFGILVNVKLWWGLPIAVVFLATVLRERRRDLTLVPLAAVVTAVVVDLPFLVLSGGQMFSSVVTVQLGRADTQGVPSGGFGRLSSMVRLERLTGVEGLMGRLFGDAADSAPIRNVTMLVCIAVVLTALVALRTPLGRLAVPVLASQVLVLLLTPNFFPFYGDFVGVSLALVIAAATRPLGQQLWALPWWGLWPAVAAVTLGVLLTTPRAVGVTQPADREALTAATKTIPCIVTDTPRVLIEIDALDRSFEGGCRNWVDFQGVARGGGSNPAAYVVGNRPTPAWRRVVVRYLRSGDAVILSDPNARFYLGPAHVRNLTGGRVVAESRGLVVHRIEGSVR